MPILDYVQRAQNIYQSGLTPRWMTCLTFLQEYYNTARSKAGLPALALEFDYDLLVDFAVQFVGVSMKKQTEQAKYSVPAAILKLSANDVKYADSYAYDIYYETTVVKDGGKHTRLAGTLSRSAKDDETRSPSEDAKFWNDYGSSSGVSSGWSELVFGGWSEAGVYTVNEQNLDIAVSHIYGRRIVALERMASWMSIILDRQVEREASGSGPQKILAPPLMKIEVEESGMGAGTKVAIGAVVLSAVGYGIWKLWPKLFGR